MFFRFCTLIFFLLLFQFRNSEETCQKVFDLVFLIDESLSVGSKNYKKKIKPFITDVLTGEGAIHVGIVKYSGRKTSSNKTYCTARRIPHWILVHNISGDQPHLAQTWADFPFTGGGATATGHGIFRSLRLIKDQGRPEVMTLLILFTDGKPYCDTYKGATKSPAYSREATDAGNKFGLTFMVIGVGKNLDVDLMLEIASTPEMYIPVSDFDGLMGIIANISTLSCGFTITCDQQCVNGYCWKPNECKCDYGWRGETCEEYFCYDECPAHSSCKGPNLCECDVGYRGTPPLSSCEPVCEWPPDIMSCGANAVCVEPWVCECENPLWVGTPTALTGCIPHCDPECGENASCEELQCQSPPCAELTKCLCENGYHGNALDKCVPSCEYDVELGVDYSCGANAVCSAPNVCECLDGYEGLAYAYYGGCTPKCTPKCGSNATCIAPQNCTCNEGYAGEPWSLCGPVCENEHECHESAKCVNPAECACREGYVGDGQVKCDPFCEDELCGNFTYCKAPNECDCLSGYKPDVAGAGSGFLECIPTCVVKTCADEFAACVEPEVCECEAGYSGDAYDKCHPICNPLCWENAECVRPGECECKDGFEYEEINSEKFCLPVCAQRTCYNHSYCGEPETCFCEVQYAGDPYHELGCQPVCTGGCGTNAECISPNVCECREDYSGDPYSVCYPVCGDGCPPNSFCANPGECVCNAGYDEIDGAGECEPICAGDDTCGTNAFCVAPGVCECDHNYGGNPYILCEYWCISVDCPTSAFCVSRNKCECKPGNIPNPDPMINCTDVCDGWTCGKNAHCEAVDPLTGEDPFPQCFCDVGFEWAGNNDNNETQTADCAPVCTTCADFTTCLAPETCACKGGYLGNPYERCEPVCDNGCGNNAFCQSPNVCECEEGFEGDEDVECSPVCYGGCGVNAECVAPGICDCQHGFTGNPYESCEEGCITPPCGKNAKCVGLGQCECRSGYEGNAYSMCLPVCQIPCGTNAECISPNVCACKSGYEGDAYDVCRKICTPKCGTGAQCNELTGKCECFPGYQGNPYTLCELLCEPPCADGAECLSPAAVCSCKEGYFGNPYEACYGYCGIEGCTANAECEGGIQCVCSVGFSGDPYDECVPVCENGCPERATCLGNNICLCDEGYEGDKCDVKMFTCLEKHPDVDACSYPNGTCDAPDKCICEDGYYGPECEKWDCFLFDKDEVLTCGKFGECIAPDTCVCTHKDYQLNIVRASCELPPVDMKEVQADYYANARKVDVQNATIVGSSFGGVILLVCLLCGVLSVALTIVTIVKNRRKGQSKVVPGNTVDGTGDSSSDEYIEAESYEEQAEQVEQFVAEEKSKKTEITRKGSMTFSNYVEEGESGQEDERSDE